jgi:hypothetical protein
MELENNSERCLLTDVSVLSHQRFSNETPAQADEMAKQD